MEFRILGPLEVIDEERGRVRLPGTKTRALLAELLINANRVVSTDRLVEAVWGEDAPETAAKTLQTYVLQLRKAVEPGRARGSPGELLLTRESGYLLAVQPEQVDALRFQRLVQEGRHALSASEPDRAALVLAQALALWRGPALSDVADDPFAQLEAVRLEELRVAALEDRIDADLAIGRSGELVPELEHLVARHPLRERLWGQLMLALYRSGRQADCLRAYQRARSILVEELGIEPGAELRRLEAAALAQDPALDFHVGSKGVDLPPALAVSGGVFVGRTQQLAILLGAWDKATGGHGGLVLLAGPEGIGKTRLLAEVARHAHAGGALVAYGRAVGPTARLHPFVEALSGIGASVGAVVGATDAGAPGQFGMALSGFLRRRASGRPVLLALDDLDRADEETLEALAALADGCSSNRALVLGTVRADQGDVDQAHLVDATNVVWIPALSRSEVVEIASHYLGAEAAESAATLLAPACEAPLIIHREAARMARSLASRRIGEASGRALGARADLRHVYDQIAGGVRDLQRLRAEAANDERIADTVSAVATCPYRGLSRFEVSDARYFFGREQVTAELVAHVVGASVLAVVGPSGSGKSSLVRAGLLPALRDGIVPGADRWTQVVMTPGPHPAHELVRRLAGRESDRIDERALGAAFDAACSALPPGGGLLVFVDQFEEVFTACRDLSERRAFIDSLVRASERPEGAVTVIVTIRSDFYGQCADYPELARLLATNQVLLGTMSAEELRRAIELPAQLAGVKVEPGLAEAMVADAADEPGGLPLLSTALVEAWERRRERTLDVAGYRERGGVKGAVARLAESAYGGLTTSQREVARRLLPRLADLGEGDASVARRVSVPELIDGHPEGAGVVATLINRRLLTSHDGMVEVAHEALLREWPRLRSWLEEDLHGRRLHRHLQRAAADWAESGREPSELYRGPRLVAALDWSGPRPDELNGVEREFLDASKGLAERETTEAQRRAQQQAVVNRRLRQLVAALAVGVVVALVAGGMALVQRAHASRQAVLAESRAVAARAVVENSLDRSLLLAREASNLDDSAETRSSLLASLVRNPGAVRVLRSTGDRLQTLALSPDGRFLAAPDNYGKTFVWDTRTFERLDPPVAVSDIGAYGVAFTPDSRTLLTSAGVKGQSGGEIQLWDLETHQLTDRLDNGFFGFADRIAMSADGRTLAAGGRDSVAVWDLAAEGRPRFTLGPRPAAQRDIALSGDGRILAAAHANGVVLVWDVPSRTLVRQLEGFPGAVALSPDGATLAASTRTGSISLIDVATGAVRGTLAGHSDLLWGLSFSADGSALASAGDDRTAIVWDVSSGTRTETLRGHTGRVLGVAFSPDARRLYTGGLDGTVMAWELSGDQRLGDRVAPPAGIEVLAGGYEWARGKPPLAVSPDGRLQAVGDAHGVVILRRLPGGEQVGRPMRASATGPVVRTAFSPDGSRLATPAADGDTVVWDVATQEEVARLKGGHPPGVYADGWNPTGRGAVVSAAWSPDGRLVATGGTNGRVVVWDVAAGAPVAEPLRASAGDGNPELYSSAVYDVAFSRDGRWLLAAVGADGHGEVVAWSMPSRALRHRFRADTTVALAVAAAPDNRTIASVGNDGKVRFWDLVTGRPLSGFLEGHGGPAHSAAFSPDGAILATAGPDGSPILWDVKSRKQLGSPLPGPFQQTRVNVAFAPDGRSLIAQYYDGQAWRWDVDPASWRDRACSVAGRNLTRDEWEKFVPSRRYRRTCDQWPAAAS